MTSESEPHLTTPEGAEERFNKEVALIDAYVKRGKVKGDPLSLESELPGEIVSRAKNRAGYFLAMGGWTNENTKPPNPNILQKVKQFFHRK